MSTRLIQFAMAAVVSAAAAGQLPRLLKPVQVSELQILKDSESQKWGRPFLLPVNQSHHQRPVRPH
jgi:hypothetical protein